jgi:biotin transport system substrate-specific component
VHVTIAIPSMNRLPAAERGITIGDFLVPITIGERMSSRAKNLLLVVTGALLIALSASVVIPVPGSPVPVTGQTFAVLLVGGALGLRRGAAASLFYLAMGLVLPVYAGHASGLDTFVGREGGQLVLGATGGYLIGFVAASAMVGWLAECGWDRRYGGAVLAMVVGSAVIYLFGIPWLMLATGFSLEQAITTGLTPFVVGDLLKLFLAAGLFPVAWWLVGRLPSAR